MHELQTNKKNRKRIGRGGKFRKTAGCGTKGQKSRSGGNVNPLFEGGRSSLMRRMKKNRGFKSPHAQKRTVTLATLERLFDDGMKVTMDTLVALGAVRKSQRKAGAKIVATGKLTKKLTVSDDISLSAAAAEALASPTNDVQKKGVKKPSIATKKTTPVKNGDDLTKIEGIGPKIAQTLTDAGVATFSALAEKKAKDIAVIIADVRGNHDPETWPKQATMARDDQWDELKKWQDEMDGGRA